MRIFENKLGPESIELAKACSNLADVMWPGRTAYRRRNFTAELFRSTSLYMGQTIRSSLPIWSIWGYCTRIWVRTLQRAHR